jgi:hypothetical protein
VNDDYCREHVCSILGDPARFPYCPDELGLQDWIERRLTTYGLDFSREYYLSPGLRIDFLIDRPSIVDENGQWRERRIGVEAKVKDSRSAIIRQLFSYAPYIAELVLVSTSIQHGYDLPATIQGKPLHFVYVGSPF